MWLGQTAAQHPHSIQSKRLKSWIRSKFLARACQYISWGSRFAGQTLVQRPQRGPIGRAVVDDAGVAVVGVVDGVFNEFDGQKPTRAAIRGSIARRFDVESVSIISYRDVTVTQVDGGFEVAAVYDHTAPFIANISFTVHFDKTRIVRR